MWRTFVIAGPVSRRLDVERGQIAVRSARSVPRPSRRGTTEHGLRRDATAAGEIGFVRHQHVRLYSHVRIFGRRPTTSVGSIDDDEHQVGHAARLLRPRDALDFDDVVSVTQPPCRPG